MKRPLSANQNRNYLAQASNEDGILIQQSHRHLAKVDKKALFNPLTLSNDISRMLPKKIQQDKERLYCQTLQLKASLNQISQENLRLKTKIATLQRQKDKLNKTEEQTLSKGKSSNFSNMHSKRDKQNGIVSSLKKMIRQAKEENESLKNEIAKIKRSIRYTKLNQVQIQKQTILDQNKRMAKVIQQLEEELSTRFRQDEQIKHLQIELDQKHRQVKEVTADNIKYEQILEDMELKNKQATQRLLVSERKWQRDLSVQKRKIEKLNRQVDLLKQQIKMLNEKLEEEKNKTVQKKISRPVSSHPYRNLDSNNLKSKATKEKEDALKINQKLKEELQQAKKKLAQSENQLQKTSEQIGIDNLGIHSRDQTFELVLTKNEANQFMRPDEQDEYKSEFEESPKPQAKLVNELPLEQKSKNKNKSSSSQNPPKYSSPVINEIKEILTFRMRYNRYPFNQLKADIEVSPLGSFTYQDLLNMLQSEPFYLTQQFASEFLKVCFGKTKINPDDQLNAAVLLKNLRAVIEDFQIIEEEEQERLLYKIAEFMTKHRGELQKEFKKIKDRHNCITKAQLVDVMHKFQDVTEQEINLAICYISINAESLQAISYTDLLDRFYINASKEFSSNNEDHQNKAEELSMGENEDLEEGQLIADDELV